MGCIILDNPNYSFLKGKEKFSKIYEICCMVDYTYAKSESNYRFPVIFSRVALEEALKLKLKINRNEKTDLIDIIDIYCKRAYIDKRKDKFYKTYLNYLRERGNDAVHDNRDIDINTANTVLKRLQYAIDTILNTNQFIEENNFYRFPKSDDEWISEIRENNVDIDKFISDFADFKVYTSKFDMLEEVVGELNRKLMAESNLRDEVEDLQRKLEENGDYKVELDNLINEWNSMKGDLSNIEDIEEYLSTINKLRDDLSDYGDVKSNVDELLSFKGEYAFLKEDVEFIKGKYETIDELKRDIDELNSKIDVRQIEELSNKLNALEDAVSNSEDIDELKSKVNDLIDLKEDYDKLKELTETLLNIKDNLSYITEDKLSPEQLKAVRSRARKLIINAGPGAGKTRVLIERVKYLLNERNVNPKSMLVITFTEKAAEELKNRLNDDADISYEKIDQMQIGTIHGFCRTFLRNYVSSGIEVIDDEDNEKKILFIKKHLDELVDDPYAYFTDLELKKVAEKFDEISTFSVDTKALEKSIIRNKWGRVGKRKDKRYIETISKYLKNGQEFPIDMVLANEDYKSRLYAHNFLAIARAYDRYLKLFDERKSYDFNLLQIKTRDNLKEMDRKRVAYKNILIDEFQDTDRVQFEIFEMLADGADSVTYVGDINQSIYWWRGSNLGNFKNLMDDDDSEFEVVNLLTNYRSPKNIVDFNNHFMVEKMELRANNQGRGDLYYLDSSDKGEEAQKIVDVIKYLYETGKIKKYSDVGLLFRSTKVKNIESLLNELKENDIKYHIKDAPDFKEYMEVEATLLLLWYLSKVNLEVRSGELDYDEEEEDSEETLERDITEYQTVLREEEFSEDLKIFGLDDFANERLNEEMLHLDSKTAEIIKGYSGSKEEFSQLDIDQLKELGISNQDDLAFFDRLNGLKKRFWNENVSVDDKLDLLSLYYEVLNLTGYVDDKFEAIEKEEIDKNTELLNLALISKKINDFMETFDRYDLNNLVEFILNYYETYSSPSNSIEDENAVQISTVHKAKGLEYPVIFICSLLEGGFPLREQFTDNRYVILNKLKYKEIYGEVISDGKNLDLRFKKELDKEFTNEEKRILYVALTRAESTLIVSHVVNKKRVSSKEFKYMKRFNEDFEELLPRDYGKLCEVNSKEASEEELELSFTSLEDYNLCPHLYNLVYNYRFVKPQNISMRIGTIIHAVLDKINRAIMDSANNEISEELIRAIIDEAIESNPDLKDSELFLSLLEDVEDYCENINLKIIEGEDSGSGNGESDGFSLGDDFDEIRGNVEESEYPFTIPWNDAKLTGSIDLILNYDDDDSIDLVDFKISDEDSLVDSLERYSNQLHFYFMAMNENSKYLTSYENTNLKIYSLSEKQFYDIELEKERVCDLEDNLMEVTKKLIDKHYPQSYEEESCEKCLLRGLCGK